MKNMHPRKKCADCGGKNISSTGCRKIGEGALAIEYYFYCRDCKSENIFNYTKYENK